MKPRLYLTMVSVLAIALLVIFVPAWRQTTSQSTQPTTHSNMGREKGVVKQPQVEASKADSKDFSALLISINGNGELLLSDAAGKRQVTTPKRTRTFRRSRAARMTARMILMTMMRCLPPRLRLGELRGGQRLPQGDSSESKYPRPTQESTT